MGSCFSKPKITPASHPTLATDSAKVDSEGNVTIHDIEHISDLRRAYDTSESRMHRRVKDCYACIFANKFEAITDLNLKFVNLGPEGMLQLSVVLPFFPKLASLRLWKTRFGSEGSGYLGRALHHMPNIRLLSLEDNDIGPGGLHKLAGSLRSLSALEELFIHLNRLGPEGGAVLGSIVSSLRNLKSITVDENNIEDEAAADLVRGLGRSSQSLRFVGLSFNKLTDASVGVLQKAVKEFRGLKRVTLNGNTVSNEMREKLLSDGPQVAFDF